MIQWCLYFYSYQSPKTKKHQIITIGVSIKLI
jgi:hypothetical protein